MGLDATSLAVSDYLIFQVNMESEIMNLTLNYAFHVLGEGLDSFWKVLLEGRNCVTDIPEERFDTTGWFSPDSTRPGSTQTTRAALIDG